MVSWMKFASLMFEHVVNAIYVAFIFVYYFKNPPKLSKLS